jgi:glycosyltransferase involved in cell wall biosynthesis
MTRTRKLRIGHVGPVATTIPAPKNGSVELVTALLTDGLMARGHDVTLFGTGSTQTTAKLHATFPAGYSEEPNDLWPWEMCELMNLAAACERWRDFDLLHYQGAYYPMSIAFSKLVGVPMVQTLHHQPYSAQVAMWQRYPDTHYVAISNYQASALTGLNSVTTVLHGVDTANFPFGDRPEDYVVFLGRFTPGKGVLEAIEFARRTNTRLLMAAPDCEYYRTTIRPHVDGKLIQYVGELDFRDKTRLLTGARALLYPIQDGEPFGLVLVEAMACGTPVVALNKGAVPEIVQDAVSGYVFETLDALVDGWARVDTLDRAAVRADAVARFDAATMVDGYEALYRRLAL